MPVYVLIIILIVIIVCKVYIFFDWFFWFHRQHNEVEFSGYVSNKNTYGMFNFPYRSRLGAKSWFVYLHNTRSPKHSNRHTKSKDYLFTYLITKKKSWYRISRARWFEFQALCCISFNKSLSLHTWVTYKHLINCVLFCIYFYFADCHKKN